MREWVFGVVFHAQSTVAVFGSDCVCPLVYFPPKVCPFSSTNVVLVLRLQGRVVTKFRQASRRLPRSSDDGLVNLQRVGTRRLRQPETRKWLANVCLAKAC